MAEPTSIQELVNQALDKLYKQTAGPVLKQVYTLTHAPNSPLQKGLRELEDECQRLEQAGAPLLPDNAVLLKTLATMEKTYEFTAALIQSADDKVQGSGAALAVNAVTAKVFSPLAQSQIQQGLDPLSPQALNFYLSTIKKNGLTWRTG